MPAPQPIFQPDLTINQTYLGNNYTIENSGAPVALPKSTKVTEGFGFNLIGQLFQPIGANRAYGVGPKNKEVRPYRFSATFIVANPEVMETTMQTVRLALESATYIVRNGWYLTVEMISNSSPEMTSYTTFNLSFTVLPRFAMWTNAPVQTEAEYLSAVKRDFVVFDGYLPPAPQPVIVPFSWVTPEALPNANIGEYYQTPIKAVGGNGGTRYGKVSGTAGVAVLPLGIVEWRTPDAATATFTVRVRDYLNQTLDRTFTINILDNFYTNGSTAVFNGSYAVTY
jgi:hypothetical protein